MTPEPGFASYCTPDKANEENEGRSSKQEARRDTLVWRSTRFVRSIISERWSAFPCECVYTLEIVFFFSFISTHAQTHSLSQGGGVDLFASLIPWALITQISAHYALIDSSHRERRETDPPTASRSASNYKGLLRLFLISGNAEGVSHIKVKQQWCGFTRRPTAHSPRDASRVSAFIYFFFDFEHYQRDCPSIIMCIFVGYILFLQFIGFFSLWLFFFFLPHGQNKNRAKQQPGNPQDLVRMYVYIFSEFRLLCQ